MSYYPPSNFLNNIFNPDDFISPNEINDTTNDITVDGNSYVKKTGDTMTGTLKVPQIEINGSTQSVAYSAAAIATIESNTLKTANITITATNTEISNLRVPQLMFNNEISQTQAFTNTDKITILENAGNIINMKTDISNNAFNIQRNTNNINNMIFYDYRINTNAGNITTNAGNITTNAGNITTNAGNITTNTGNITTNAGNIATNASSILSLQNNALSAVDTEKLTHLNTHSATEFYMYSISNRNMILHPGTGDIKLWADTVTIGNNSGGKLQIGGEIQNHAYTDEDHEKTTHFETDANKFAIYSREDKNIFLNSGNGYIQLYSNELRFGNANADNRFILNGETQYRAYTEELHAYYISKIEQLTEQVNWLVYERIRQQKLDSVIAPNNHVGASTWIFNKIVSTSENTFDPIADYTSYYPNTSQYGQNL